MHSPSIRVSLGGMCKEGGVVCYGLGQRSVNGEGEWKVVSSKDCRYIDKCHQEVVDVVNQLGGSVL